MRRNIKRQIINKNPANKRLRGIFATRYLQGGERETVEHKLKILKQELKHIIRKLSK